MKSEEFVKGFYKEKESLLDFYFNSKKNESEIGALIKSLNLDEKGNERIRQIINGVLRDSFYTTLLGIDGAAQIGGHQELYKLIDENDNEITGGKIEAYAWEYFHNHKFETDKGEADFIAELEYKSEGGRTIPAVSGYRPQIKFGFDEMQTSGQQNFIDRKLVFPGDKVTAEVNILSIDYFANKLEKGMKFEFREGAKIIGIGEIKEILNTKLKKKISS